MRENAIQNWLSYARKITVGTHKEVHFKKNKQFHFYQYGDKNSLFACDICDMWGKERKRMSKLPNQAINIFLCS